MSTDTDPPLACKGGEEVGAPVNRQGNFHVTGCSQEKLVPQAHSPLFSEGFKNFKTTAAATLP